jgi:hypothetical protein
MRLLVLLMLVGAVFGYSGGPVSGPLLEMTLSIARVTWCTYYTGSARPQK